MMKNIKLYLIILALAAIAFFAIKGYMDAKGESRGFKSSYAALQDSAKILKDKNGILHAQNINLRLSKQQAQVFFSEQIDSMASLLKVKPSQVKSIVYVPFQANINIDSLKTALARTDTVEIHLVDTVPGRVQLNALMSLTRYEKGTGFLGLRKKQYLDVHFDNPIFHPLDVTGFDITPEKKFMDRIRPGVQLGYGVTPDGLTWYAGIGITLSF